MHDHSLLELSGFNLALTVLVVLEDRLGLIAATHDVVERSGKMYSWLLGHNRATQFENHKIAIKLA